MVDKLVHKLSQQRRHEITLEVRESNLPAQLFFRSQGLVASGVLRGYYEDTEEDAYQMKYQLAGHDDLLLPFAPKNRISEFEGTDNRAA
jgi:ribosomal-protein-alanine N-acetyltransferase